MNIHWKKIFFFASLFLLGMNVLYFFYSKEFRFKYIVIHHTAGNTGNYRTIRAYQQKERGWRDAAYHMILSNGSTKVPLGTVEVTGRYQTLSYAVATKSYLCNYNGIHIAIVGNYDKKKLPRNLQKSLVHLIQLLQAEFNIPKEGIVLHQTCSSTLCPGRFINQSGIHQWTREWKGDLDPKLKRQHRQAIQDYSLQYSYPHLLAFNSVLIFLSTLVFAIVLFVRSKILNK